jgi:hypothetical protein
MTSLKTAKEVRERLPSLIEELRAGQVTATSAATEVLDTFEQHWRTHD